jgi:hypothetical protein
LFDYLASNSIFIVISGLASITGIGILGFVAYSIKRLRERSIKILSAYICKNSIDSGSLDEIGMRGIKYNNSGIVIVLNNLTDTDLFVVDIEAKNIFQNVVHDVLCIKAADSAEIPLSNIDAQGIIDYSCVRYKQIEDYMKQNLTINVTLASNKGHKEVTVNLNMSFVPQIMDSLYLDEEVPYFYPWNDKGEMFISYWRDKSMWPKCKTL